MSETLSQNQKGQLLFFALSRALILGFLPAFISDLPGYLAAADFSLVHAMIPYLDFSLEYPPLAFVFLAAARGITQLLHLDSQLAFRLALGIFILPFDYMCLRGLQKSATDRSAALYLVFTCMLAPLLYDRLDLIVAASIALPFLQAQNRFGLLWGFGGALKLLPASFLALEAAHEKSIKPLLAAIPMLLTLALAFALAPAHTSLFSFHGARGLQIESLPATILFALEKLHATSPISVESNFGAQQIAGFAAFTTICKILYAGILIATFASLAALLSKRMLKLRDAVWLALLTALSFSYVLSTQYILWLIPMGLIATHSRATKTLLYAVVTATAVHFLFYWSYAEDRAGLSVALLLARNGALLALLGASWRQAFNKAPQ